MEGKGRGTYYGAVPVEMDRIRKAVEILRIKIPVRNVPNKNQILSLI